MKRLMVFMASAFIVLALSACGGGGGGGDDPSSPVPSNESFALTQALFNYIEETSSSSFSVSGNVAGEDVTGAGNLSIGAVSSGTFEGVSALVKTSTVTGSISVAGESVPYAGTSLTYFDTNYVYLGDESVGYEYSVATMVNSIPDFVKVGDTGVWYYANNYTDSLKTFLLTTSTVSYSVEPDTASTAILKIINTESDGSVAVVSYRMTVDGSLTRVSESETDPADSTVLVITYDNVVVVPPPVQTSSLEGLYTGRTSTGRLTTGIILNDNTFYILYSTIGVDDEIAGLVQGNLTLSGNTYTSTNAKDFNLEGSGVLPATVQGSYVEKQSTSGSVYYPTLLETIGYNTVYDAAYELTPSIATITGSYSGEVVTSSGWETAALTISSTGILSGIGSSGCSVSGTVLPSKSGNTYNMTLTFGGPPCLFANQTLSGVSYYNTPENRLTGAVINATRTDGVLFTGQKSALPPSGQCIGEVISPINLTIGTPLNQTIEAFGRKYYVFDVVDPATYTISLYNMATDNDWMLIEYVSNCEDDYPLDPPLIAESINFSTTPEIKAVSLNPAKYLLIVDEWDDRPSSYTLSVTR